jgi:hypothetical protein
MNSVVMTTLGVLGGIALCLAIANQVRLAGRLCTFVFSLVVCYEASLERTHVTAIAPMQPAQTRPSTRPQPNANHTAPNKGVGGPPPPGPRLVPPAVQRGAGAGARHCRVPGAGAGGTS